MAKASRPAVPTPRVNVTVNIRPGAPPKDLGGHKGAGALPKGAPAKLAKLEAQLMKHLAANAEDRARFLTDPVGILRKVAPGEGELHAALDAARQTSGSVHPDVPDAQLGSLKVNVAKKPPAKKPPAKKPPAKKPPAGRKGK
jgi:hypothetical protein